MEAAPGVSTGIRSRSKPANGPQTSTTPTPLPIELTVRNRSAGGFPTARGNYAHSKFRASVLMLSRMARDRRRLRTFQAAASSRPVRNDHSLTPRGVFISSQNPMRFGINSFLFTSPFTNDSTRLFSKFKKWGFDTVEIPVEDPSHIDPYHVKKELDKHKLACGTVCACMGPGRDFRGVPEEQKA